MTLKSTETCLSSRREGMLSFGDALLGGTQIGTSSRSLNNGK